VVYWTESLDLNIQRLLPDVNRRMLLAEQKHLQLWWFMAQRLLSLDFDWLHTFERHGQVDLIFYHNGAHDISSQQLAHQNEFLQKSG